MTTLLAKGEKELFTRVDEPADSTAVVPQPSTSLASATVPPGDNAALMFERLARDPNVDVDKLERLIGMQERIMRHNAKSAFDSSFAKMQPEIPVIDEHGRIEVKGELRSTYAPLEDIHEVIKPLCAKWGFSVRHRTEWPQDRAGIIRIVGILSHEQGHREESVFEAPLDKSEYRSAIQSMGSTVSYGRRYTTMDLLNIATRKADNDGRKRGPEKVDKPAPEGFDAWLAVVDGVAGNGDAAFEKAWADSKPEFRKFLIDTAPKLLAGMRTKARKAGK